MKFVLTLLLTLFTLICQAQISPALSDELTNILETSLDNDNVKGISAAVNSPDGSIWRHASGLANTNTDLTVDMHLFGGSTTKSFCAALILQLHEAGLLSIDDSISTYLPTYNNIDPNISIRQLLDHTSGIYNYTDNENLDDLVFADPTKIIDPYDILSTMIKAPDFTPGDGFSYSNTNYLLAGLIVERVTDQRFAEVLRGNILEPLAMQQTSFGAFEDPVGDFGGFWLDSDGNGTLDDLSIFPTNSLLSSAFSAGAIVSTPQDLSIWIKSLITTDMVIGAGTRDLLLEGSDQNSSYGLGIVSGTYGPCDVYGHGGSIVHQTQMFYIEDLDVSFVIMVNGGGIPQELLVGFFDAIKASDFTSSNIEFVSEEVVVYPNPFTDRIQVNIPQGVKAPSHSIFDMNGREVYHQVIEPGQRSTELIIKDLDRLSTGLYIYHIQDGENIYKAVISKP